MIYLICQYLMLIGLLGFLAQLLLGMTHAGHTGHAGAHGAASHHGHLHAPAHSSQAVSSASKTSDRVAAGTVNFLLTLLSPLMIFSICLGAGAAGLLLKHLHLAIPEVVGAAAASGIGFYGVIVRPIWQTMFRFASAPSTGLEGAVGSEARATSRFDQTGRGLIALTVDGRIANNVLAFLDNSDKENAEEIKPGDVLTVISVDAHKNTCHVARL